MRKYMTKEVTSTKVEFAKISVNEKGLPEMVHFDPEYLLGNISQEKAQKRITAKHGLGVTVFNVTTISETYKMKVTDFIKYAELVTENDNLEEEETEEESGNE